MAGILTLSQMIDEVADNVSKSTSAQTKSTKTLSTMITRYLNRAQTKISRKYDFLFCIATANTVADQQTYAFPSTMNAVYTLRLENGLRSVKLIPAMPWEFDKLVPKANESTSRQPQWYIPYRTTNTFELFPIPDASYVMRIRYSALPTTLSDSNQTSDYTLMDDFLVQDATAQLFLWLQEYKDAEAWFKMSEVTFEDCAKSEQESVPDWEPVGQGFSSGPRQSPGEYYNDPFVTTDPSGRF